MANEQNAMAEVTLQTSRLILRPIQLEDAADVFAIRSQEVVTRWLWSGCTKQSDAEDWIRKVLQSPGGFCFAIELLPSERAHYSHSTKRPRNVIGTCGSRNPPNMGYCFHLDYWGHGYATEALRAVMDRFWAVWPDGYPSADRNVEDEQHMRPVIIADTFAENLASQRVLTKLGFEAYGKSEDETERGLEEVILWRKWKPEPEL